MDPFSVVVGVGSLVEMSLQLGKYLKNVYEAAASFEDDIGSLFREIKDLDSVNKSIEHLHNTEAAIYNFGLPELPRQGVEVWQNIAKTLENCSETLEDLRKVLEAVIGSSGVKVTGRRDGIKKHLRKQAKDGELETIRLKLSVHRESLSVSLTLLNLMYTQKGSKDTQLFGFKLHKQIASLQARLSSADTDTPHNSLHSATAVASTLRLNKHFDTPKAVSSIYTGRKGYLDGLKQAFDSSHVSREGHPTHKRFVVFGLGGAGKTQFCCKFASDNKQRFWGVFTVDASSPGNAQQSFIAIAKACGTDPNERAAKSWLSSSDRPWLLLIDNADDTELEIERYFPDGEHGLTLITTRNPEVKMHGTIGRRFYHFERLDDKEASELLLRAADNNEPRTPKIMQLASAITKKLGALPLALIHAGNAIKARYCKLSNYIAYYERSWDMIRHSQNGSGQNEDDPEYMKVYASYEIVFRGLEAINLQRYSDAVQLLKLFSFLHYENIPFDILIAAVEHPRIQRIVESQGTELANSADSSSHTLRQHLNAWRTQLRSMVDSLLLKQFENQNPVVLPTFLRDAELSSPPDDCKVRLREALHLLTRLSLITHYEASDSYSMHPLVHTWVRQRPQMKVRDQAVWCEAALHTLSRCILLPPLNELVDPHGDLARKLLSHIVSVGKLQRKIELEFVRKRCERLRPWPALESCITPWRAMFLAKSAIVYMQCGDFVEGETCLRIVTDFNQRFRGPNHPRTERAKLAMSDCLWHQCRVTEAADIHEQVYQVNQRTLGSDHPRTLRLMARLGESRRQQGRLAESIELLTQAMIGMETVLLDKDPAIYYALEQLGISLRACFQFEEARQHQEKATAGLKHCLGERDMRTLTAMEELAITYKELSTVHRNSNIELAYRYLQTAHRHATFVVEQCKKQFGDKSFHTWKAQGALGRIKAEMGDVDEAETLFSTILPVVARHVGDHHLGVLSGRNHHSKFLIQQKRYDEAEAFLLDISRPDRYKTAAFTGDHPDRWDALWTLVDCYQKQGKIDRSLATCNELLKAVEAIRQGRKQTEISSTFWKMILEKRAELKVIQGSGIAGDPSVSLAPPNTYIGVRNTSSETQIVATLGAGELRVRNSTW